RAPAGARGSGIKHAQELVRVLVSPDEIVAIAIGIGAGGVRQLVDEALAEETVLAVVDTAPEADRHMRVANRIVGKIVRHVIGHVLEEALMELQVDAIGKAK